MRASFFRRNFARRGLEAGRSPPDDYGADGWHGRGRPRQSFVGAVELDRPNSSGSLKRSTVSPQ
jgi:hypothetical protein